MFKPELCDFCGDCLVECTWMQVRRETASEWMREMAAGKRTPAVDRCLTCYACNETCPTKAHPFDLIASLQEKFGALSSAENARANEARYQFSGEVRDLPRAERIMSVCVFGKTDGNLIQGSLYDLPRVGGKPFFCWVLFSHLGAESIQKKHAGEMVERLAATGAKEVVCFHDDCYAMLKKLAPEYGIDVPFRPVHLAEYLVEKLSANRTSIKKLGMKIAYQRPCASRHTPEKEHFIDELFKLTGVTRVKRVYDREKAMCCAGIKMLLGKGDPAPDQEKNLRDALDAGAEALVCLCPMCLHSLSETASGLGLPLVFIGDLARASLSEMELPGNK